MATAWTSASARSSQSIIGPTLSIAITATISVTGSNFSCAFAHPCTATARTRPFEGGTRCPQRVGKITAASPPDIRAFGDWCCHRLRSCNGCEATAKLSTRSTFESSAPFALVRAFPSVNGFGADGTRQIPWYVRARISSQRFQRIRFRPGRRLRHRPRWLQTMYMRHLWNPGLRRPE